MPPYIKYIFKNIFYLFFFFILLRILFFTLAFKGMDQLGNREVFRALKYGLRFDIRTTFILLTPLNLWVVLANNRFFRSKVHRLFSNIYLTIVYLAATLFALTDIGFYDYLGERLDATALRFLDNWQISAKMVSETYPVFWAGFGLLIFIVILYKFFDGKFSKFIKSDKIIKGKKKFAYFFLVLFVTAFGIYNSFSFYPLRWSQAFFSKNKTINQLSLNPVLFFYDSYKFRNEGFEIQPAEDYFPAMANYLNIKNNPELDFKRTIPQNDTIQAKKPNVVVVMLESLGAVPMSHFGNPMKGTPNLDSLYQNSISFNNFFVHRIGTARSVFASITGLPDVVNAKTASRNPNIINQRIIYDQFDGYEKLYFLGGSANWANIRAVFQSNIRDLKIFEEGSYETEKRSDVWGIDDYELFKESDKELKKLHDSNKPFIAYIQTSSNHRPFTVPDERESYKPLTESEVDMVLLDKAGFKNIKQYNALRYLDYNVKRYIDRAKEAGYFDNTIFLFYGDHNTSINPYTHMERKEYELEIGQYHVPCFILAPDYMNIENKEYDFPSNLIDIMPTLASTAGIKYTNYTLGINLLDTTRTKHNAFIYDQIQGEPALGVIGKDYFYKTNISGSKSILQNLNNGSLDDVKTENPFVTEHLDSLAKGFYYETKYLYYNNKKDEK